MWHSQKTSTLVHRWWLLKSKISDVWPHGVPFSTVRSQLLFPCFEGLRHSLSTRVASCELWVPRTRNPFRQDDVGNWQKHVYPGYPGPRADNNKPSAPTPWANKTQSNIIINEGRTQTTNASLSAKEGWPHAALPLAGYHCQHLDPAHWTSQFQFQSRPRPHAIIVAFCANLARLWHLLANMFLARVNGPTGIDINCAARPSRRPNWAWSSVNIVGL